MQRATDPTRWGRRNTNSYLVGYQELQARHRQGLTLQLDRLPWHAQQVAAQLQLQGVWA